MEIKKNIIDKIDTNKIIDILQKIISIPSPTGYTEKISEYLVDFAVKNEINYFKTNKGSIIYKFEFYNKTKVVDKGICFAAHMDTLGLMVKSASNDSIKVVAVGGIPPIYSVGDYVTIKSSNDKEYHGTILPENPAAHVNKKIYDFVPNYDEMFLRLDYKPKEDEKISSLIQIGDFVFLDSKFQYIDGFIKTRFLDDKASCSIFLHIAQLLSSFKKEENIIFSRPVYFYFNVTEETGQGIANLPDIDELYIVDMGVVGTGVNGDEFSVSICPKDSSGPYNYELTRKLEELSIKNNIQYKKDIFPYYGSDGSAALRAGKDLKVALFGVGVSASHGYERTHETGLTNTAKLMASILEENIS